MKKKALLIDDENNILKVLSAALKNIGFTVRTASTGEEAIRKFTTESFNIVLSDYKMPGMDGVSLLTTLKDLSPSTPVILMTGYGTIEHAVQAMRLGAYSYLTKPINLDTLNAVILEAIRVSGNYYDEEGSDFQFLNIIGRSPAIKEVFAMIRRVSKTDANVLILGESGTGKELIARAIHYSSLKCGGPFIPLDCTTIPSELVESELFGHEKGAFTCAYENKTGLLEMANKGTIFLDEIGDLDYSLQKKLLRFLQEKEFFRLGGEKRVKVDARVLAATNRNLEEAVQKGSFREDLYYRLNVITIHIPPLRERKGDIQLLANHFLNAYNKQHNKDIRGYTDSVLDIFTSYEWPGNVRELENAIERAVILCNYDYISEDCLPRKLCLASDKKEQRQENLSLPEMERNIILRALESTGGNQSKASEILGISRKQLRTKMKNLDLFVEK